MANLTSRRDSYLDYLRAGIKQDTLAAQCSTTHALSVSETATGEGRGGDFTHKRKAVTTTPVLPLQRHLTNLTRSLVSLPGNRLNSNNRARKIVVKPLPINRNWPRGKNTINYNYCVNCVTGKKNCVHVTSKRQTVNFYL